MTAFADVKPAALKVRVKPQFPSDVIGRDGVLVEKENGTFYISSDPALLQSVEDYTTTAAASAVAAQESADAAASAAAATRAFDTVAELNAATLGAAVTNVTLLGYYDRGDCEPWTLVRRASMPSLPGYQTSNSATVYWDLPDRSVLNVCWFGAKGDNSFDNATAFATCQSAINQPYGGAIYLPYGIFLTSGPLLDSTFEYPYKIEGSANADSGLQYQTTTVVHTGGASGGSLIIAHGTNGVEISHINLAFSSPLYGGPLIDFSQSTSPQGSGFIHLHNFRAGGLVSATGLGATIIKLSDAGSMGTLKVLIENGFIDNGLVGILGADTGEFASIVQIKNVWFNGTWGALPIIAGGNTWTIEGCVFERRNDLLAAAIQTTNRGVDAFTIRNNQFDDGETTGTWINVNNGPILGGVIQGNWFRNGERAIDLGTSRGVTISGNKFYALEHTHPILAGDASDITAFSNDITTDSGLNVPPLIELPHPTGSSLFDNIDGLGIRYGVTGAGYVTLPGNVLMAWGTATSVGTIYGSISFPTTFGAAPIVTATVADSANAKSVTVASVTTTAFTAAISSGTEAVNWTAIGEAP